MATTHVGSSGPVSARFAIVGEAPGAEERRQGKPFVGPSGQLLREAFERVGIDPDEAYITNVYKEYRYGNPTPTKAEIAEARTSLVEELSALPNLEAVLVLGNTPLTALTGLTAITKNRGVQESEWLDVPVFATLHPAAVLRNVRYKSDWLNDLSGFAASLNGITEDFELRVIDSAMTVYAMEADMEYHKGVGALDIETTIGDVFKGEVQLVSVAVSFDGRLAYASYPGGPHWDLFMARLQQGKWIMHNGSFDLLVLKMLYPNHQWTLHQDTMAMAYLLHPEERKGLQVLAGVYLGLPPYKDVDYKNILDESIEKVMAMNGRDVARTVKLFRALADELNQHPHLSRTYQWLLLPAITALVDMTIAGVPVDRERLDELRASLSSELEDQLAELQAQVGKPNPRLYGKDDWPKGAFNPGSPQQVAHVLFDLKGLPIIKYTKKDGKETENPSTDKEVLEKLYDQTGDSLLASLMQYRKASKLLTAFINSWTELMDENDRLHPRYKPTQVVTGRLSAEKPNIQQVPRDGRFRGVFGGVEGMTWVKADLSQIELRVAAWLADESYMIRAYQADEDLHALTAKRMLGVEDVLTEWQPGRTARDAGKMFNFSLLYGAYPAKLVEIARSQYGITLTKREAEKYRAIFFESYPRLAEWHSEVRGIVRSTGRIESPLGRVRTFPEINDPDEWIVKKAEREAINHPVQSFANDLVLSALVRLPREVRRYAIADVHDELDFLMPDEVVAEVIPVIQETMEDVSWLKKWGIDLPIPVLAEVTTGKYWKE